MELADSREDSLHHEHLRLPLIECGNGHYHLTRFTFALPEPIGVEDGFSSVHVWTDDDTPRTTWAKVAIHQFELPAHPDGAVIAATLRLAQGEDGTPTEEPNEGGASETEEHDLGSSLTTRLSIAQVVTPFSSPGGRAAEWDQQMRHLSPQNDAFVRALYATQTVVRAANLAQNPMPVRLPSYEALTLVLTQDAALFDCLVDVENLIIDWSEPAWMTLDKQYQLPPKPGEVPGALMHAWQREIGFGNPAIAAKENFRRAQRLMEIDGDYSQGVIAAAIGLESLCYNLVSATYWETSFKEGLGGEASVEAAAEALSSRSTPPRIAEQRLPRLLGGDWSSPTSAWTTYRETTAPLRNRIVHTGLLPRRAEASAAVAAAFEAHSFLLDRLAENRHKYPLCTYIFLGSVGLKQRDLLQKKIREMFEAIASEPDDPSLAYAEWNRALEIAIQRQSRGRTQRN